MRPKLADKTAMKPMPPEILPDPSSEITINLLTALWEKGEPGNSQNVSLHTGSWNHLWSALPALAEANPILVPTDEFVRAEELLRYAYKKGGGHLLYIQNGGLQSYPEMLPPLVAGQRFQQWIVDQLKWCLALPIEDKNLHADEWENKRFSLTMQMIAHLGEKAAAPTIREPLLELWRRRWTYDMVSAFAESARFADPQCFDLYVDALAGTLLDERRLTHYPALLWKSRSGLQRSFLSRLVTELKAAPPGRKSGIAAYLLAKMRDILPQEQRGDVVAAIQDVLSRASAYNPGEIGMGNFEYALALLSSPDEERDVEFVQRRDKSADWISLESHLEGMARLASHRQDKDQAIQRLLALCWTTNVDGTKTLAHYYKRWWVYASLERLGKLAAYQEVLEEMVGHIQLPRPRLGTFEEWGEWDLSSAIGRLGALANQETQEWLRRALLDTLKNALRKPSAESVLRIIDVCETFRILGPAGASAEILDYFIRLLYVGEPDLFCAGKNWERKAAQGMQEAMCRWGDAVRADVALKDELTRILSGAGMQEYRQLRHQSLMAPIEKSRCLSYKDWQEKTPLELAQMLRIRSFSKPPLMGPVRTAFQVSLRFLFIYLWLNLAANLIMKWGRLDSLPLLLPSLTKDGRLAYFTRNVHEVLEYIASLGICVFRAPFCVGALAILLLALWNAPMLLRGIKLPLPLYRWIAWMKLKLASFLVHDVDERSAARRVSYAAVIALSGLELKKMSEEDRSLIRGHIRASFPDIPPARKQGLWARLRDWCADRMTRLFPKALRDWIFHKRREAQARRDADALHCHSGRLFESREPDWQPWIDQGIRIFRGQDGKMKVE